MKYNMSRQEELQMAHSDMMTIISHAKKIGWDPIGKDSLQRITYLLKVLYAFCHEDKNIFEIYHFNVTVFGPYSDLVFRSLIFLQSSQRLIEDSMGNLKIISTDGVDAVSDEEIKWIDCILLILGKYGENKVFSFVVNDPQYNNSVKANISAEINCGSESDTIKTLNDFKLAFEETLEDTTSISKEEYISLYFDFLFSQIIKG